MSEDLATPAKVTAKALADIVASRYCLPEWHIEHEFTYEGKRLDVVGMNLFPSRGYMLIGFELKVSRADWLRELQSFEKTEAWTSIVDKFYIVAPKGVVELSEVPKGWGFLQLQGERLFTKVQPAHRPVSTTFPREITMRLLRRITDQANEATRHAEFRARNVVRDEIRAEVEAREATRQRDAQVAHDELRKHYNELLGVLGVEATHWRKHEEAMRAAGVFSRMVHSGERNLFERQLQGTMQSLDAFKKSLEATIASVRDG